MRIARDQLQSIIDHAVRDLPNECCGVVGARDGLVTDVVPLRNIHASPYRFEADGMELFRAMERIEAEGKDLVAIYHSHPRTEAYPSQTDQALSAGYPGLEWIIVGHVQSEPVVRTFVVTPDSVDEVALEVE